MADQREILFNVPGDPVGYYAHGSHPNWTRMKQYHAYKAKVQLYAATAGLVLPIIATKDAPAYICVTPYFRTGVHCDPGNVQKGICDALFWTKDKSVKGSGDKHTGGAFTAPKYDRENPRVEVLVTWTEPATLLAGVGA